MNRRVELAAILAGNPVVAGILDAAPSLGLPHWYLGAGCVAQTVWNDRHHFEPTHGVVDFDLIYFDPTETTAAGERATGERVRRALASTEVDLDVTNQARVHQWYPSRFGRSIPPFRSAEEAIASWPTTASSIGVRPGAGGLVVCAPFGLEDLFGLIVRPNKALVDRAVYERKARRWARTWPGLVVVPW